MKCKTDRDDSWVELVCIVELNDGEGSNLLPLCEKEMTGERSE